MDFMHDQFSDVGRCRLFNVINDFNQKGLTIYVDFSLPVLRVIRSLNQIIECAIRCDNEPEYFSHQLESRAKKHKITLCFIQLSHLFGIFNW